MSLKASVYLLGTFTLLEGDTDVKRNYRITNKEFAKTNIFFKWFP